MLAKKAKALKMLVSLQHQKLLEYYDFKNNKIPDFSETVKEIQSDFAYVLQI